MGSIHSLRKSCKTFKPFLQGFLVCTLLVVSIDNASGKKFKPDFSSHNRKLIVSVLHTLGPFIKEKQISGSAPLLCWSELIGALNSQSAPPHQPFRRFSKVADDNDEIQPPLVRLDNQSISKNGRTKVIPPQYVTQTVYDAYIRMNQRMQKDLGTTLRIESGYRSPAYQFYLFLSRLPRHKFNVAETNRHVALPGQSEHGSHRHPAIDLINAAGINGEDNPGSSNRCLSIDG